MALSLNEPRPDQILQVGTGFWASKILLSAVELELFTEHKAYETLPSGGALIIYESIIDDDRSKNAFGLMMSLNMLIETPGGFDYTGADCTGWMKDAGFNNTRVEHLVGPDSMVVGIK